MNDLLEQIKKLDAENRELREENQVFRLRLEQALYEITKLKEENQNLKDEIAILKKQKPRPKIPPSRLEKSNNTSDKADINEDGNGKSKPNKRKSKKNKLNIHNVVRIKPDAIPLGSVLKGVKRFTVQDIRIESNNTVYEIERWLKPDGTYLTGELPEHVAGHYGPELKAYVLYQHYACRVTEPLLLDSLRAMGVMISAGQLNRILVENNDGFHEEKQELLQAAIHSVGQIQVDDIGARHDGKNGYTTVIGNEFFAFFSTSSSKSRINFLQILHGSEPKYLLNDDAWDYIKTQKPKSKLASSFSSSSLGGPVDKKDFDALLKQANISGETSIRQLTEGALYASLIDRGIPRNLSIHADDARQFAVFISSLCWIHEERHYRKIPIFTDEMEKLVSGVRQQIWELYQGLKAYKENPSGSEKKRLEELFDEIFSQKTSSPIVNERLALTREKKDRLLRVLLNPSVPLHNNATETDGRSGVVIKKVSGGTRSDKGKNARDTFLSLKQTTRKLGINFWNYLKDRISRQNKIPRLSHVINVTSQKVLELFLWAH